MKIDVFLEQMVVRVKAMVAREASALAARLDELDARLKAFPAGPSGERGPQGEKGERGDAGPVGERGEQGEKGLPGERGEPGAPGESIRGDKGDPGEAGPRGEKGEPGPVGDRGERGEKGDTGRDGRDALALDVLPAIDEARSYPRGIWARHLNGLWRAAGDTQGMRNWECMVPGLAEVVIAHEERSLTLSVALSNGHKVEKTVVLENPIDRGVWAPDLMYLKGDGVTWGGSWFIAQVNEPMDKPGTSDQWRLAVKRGRDGKDAK